MYKVFAMSKKTVLIFCLLLLSAGCWKQNLQALPAPSPLQQYGYTHQLKIGGQSLMVEIATSPSQMEQGLSGRASMADNQGMLFDFFAGGGSASGGGNAATPAFWMKDMKFNLDFIWIAGGKVVGITSDVNHPNSLSDPLPTYSPPEPVNQVLEVSAGWAKKNGIIVGDDVSLGQ
jgi:uncharacterized protein